jgi:tetratricopeptide (TPR) repeat protein
MRIGSLVLLLLLLYPVSSVKAQPPSRHEPPFRFSDEFVEKYQITTDLVLEGDRLLREGKIDAALPLFEKASQIEPKDSRAFKGMLECYIAKGEEEKVFAMYGELLREGGTFKNSSISYDTKYRLRYALMLHKRGKREEAIAYYNKAADFWEADRGRRRNDAASPYYFPPVEKRFPNVYYSNNQFEGYIHLLLGVIEFNRGEKKQALSELEKALEKQPKLGLAYFYRGEAVKYSRQVADITKAVESFVYAYTYDRRHLKAPVRNAIQYGDPSVKEKAKSALEKAIIEIEGEAGLEPQTPNKWDTKPP